jgi:hypothetical protein
VEDKHKEQKQNHGGDAKRRRSQSTEEKQKRGGAAKEEKKRRRSKSAEKQKRGGERRRSKSAEPQQVPCSVFSKPCTDRTDSSSDPSFEPISRSASCAKSSGVSVPSRWRLSARSLSFLFAFFSCRLDGFSGFEGNVTAALSPTFLGVYSALEPCGTT